MQGAGSWARQGPWARGGRMGRGPVQLSVTQETQARQASYHLGGWPRVCCYIKHKATGDKTDSCHQVESKAPSIHTKGRCRANVGGKKTPHHPSCSHGFSLSFHVYVKFYIYILYMLILIRWL